MPDNGAHGPGPEIPRGAPQGERSHRWDRKTPRRKIGLSGFAHIDRGHGRPVVRNERKAGSGSGLPIDGASACRSWHADLGASQASKRHRRSARSSTGGSEMKEGRSGDEKRETSFVGWAKARASRAVPTIFECRESRRWSVRAAGCMTS
jgi:hypothetical protein